MPKTYLPARANIWQSSAADSTSIEQWSQANPRYNLFELSAYKVEE